MRQRQLRQTGRRRRKLFSLIFADPPYGTAAQELLANANLPELLAVDGSLVLESAKRESLTVSAPWELIRESIYGDTRVSFLRKNKSGDQ